MWQTVGYGGGRGGGGGGGGGGWRDGIIMNSSNKPRSQAPCPAFVACSMKSQHNFMKSEKHSYLMDSTVLTRHFAFSLELQ